jgi:murein DD-endopeptidase MepM/ murein hydrolase activator NlpD
VYVVQPGDSIWNISQLLGISVDELIGYNNLSDPGLLKIGDRLVIPNFQDVQGEILFGEVPLGESQRSLSRKYGLRESLLARLNRQVNPGLYIAGSNIILLKSPDLVPFNGRSRVPPGCSLLELAVLQEIDPWELVSMNHLAGRWDGLPGDVLSVPGETQPGPGALPPEISLIALTPLPLVQGKTSVLRLSTASEMTLSGSLAGYPLSFFPDESGGYVAMQGLQAMQSPGTYPVDLVLSLPDGSQFPFSQPVYLVEGSYLYDPTLYVDPSTINPEVTRPEDAEWTALAAPVTPDKLWSGQFLSPVAPEFSDCWPSRFGNRRSYNDSPYDYFHTGLDFCGAVGNSIFAPADGIVVFAGPLSVRGNATMINHGWGIYSGYMHQSELMVQVGERVTAGQLVGLVGATGRVTGAHLHWEIWAGGVQVDPLDWLQAIYP